MATIESSDVVENNLGGSQEDVFISKDNPSSQDEVNNDPEIRQPLIRISPEVIKILPNSCFELC